MRRLRSWKIEQIKNSLLLLDELLAKHSGKEDLLRYGVAFQTTKWALECLDDVAFAFDLLYSAVVEDHADPALKQFRIAFALAFLSANEVEPEEVPETVP